MLGLGAAQAGVLRLSFGAFELGLRLLDVRDGGGAAMVEVLGQLERPGIVRNRAVEEALFLVQAAQREVVAGELGMQCKVQGCEVTGCRLLVGARSCDGVADAAEKVDFVGKIAPEVEAVPCAFLAMHIGRRVGRALPARDAADRVDGRKPGSAREAGLRTCLLETRQRSLEALIGAAELAFEGIELGITEHRPPAATWRGIRRRRYLPVAAFLVGGGRGGHGGRVLVARRERAAAEAHREQRRGRGARRASHEECSAAGVAGLARCGCPRCAGGCCTRTCIPSATESGGLTTSVSSAAMPASTSISVPKSRPSVIFLRCTRCS